MLYFLFFADWRVFSRQIFALSSGRRQRLAERAVPHCLKQKTSDVVTKNPSKEHEKHESGTSHTFYKLEEHPIEEKYTGSKHTGHAITSTERCCC